MLKYKGLVGVNSAKKGRKTIVSIERTTYAKALQRMYLVSTGTVGRSSGLGQRDGGGGGCKMRLGT